MDAINANPTNRTIAGEIGVSKGTVDSARRSGGQHCPPDDTPTIDNPPKGRLWEDQDDGGVIGGGGG
jgi:hypothetical protein